MPKFYFTFLTLLFTSMPIFAQNYTGFSNQNMQSPQMNQQLQNQAQADNQAMINRATNDALAKIPKIPPAPPEPTNTQSNASPSTPGVTPTAPQQTQGNQAQAPQMNTNIPSAQSHGPGPQMPSQTPSNLPITPSTPSSPMATQQPGQPSHPQPNTPQGGGAPAQSQAYTGFNAQPQNNAPQSTTPSNSNTGSGIKIPY